MRPCISLSRPYRRLVLGFGAIKPHYSRACTDCIAVVKEAIGLLATDSSLMAEAGGRFFSFPLVSSEDDQLSDDILKNLLSEAQPSGGEYADFAVHSSPQQMPTFPPPTHSSPQHLQPELPPFSQPARGDYREHSSPESIQPLTFDDPTPQQHYGAQASHQTGNNSYGMQSFSQALDIAAPLMPYQPFNNAQQARFQQPMQPYDFEVVAENTQHGSPQQYDFLQVHSHNLGDSNDEPLTSRAASITSLELVALK